MKRMLLVTLLSVFVGACATGSSVPVKGPTADVVKLAGDWEGEYEGSENGRRGVIKFELTKGYHTASGQVLMQAEGGTEPMPLAIEFVQIEDGSISGKIQPYQDPSCQCEVQTEFLGYVDGDVIDGTYVSKAGATATSKGRWSVVRKN